jgi:hypothetical protein
MTPQARLAAGNDRLQPSGLQRRLTGLAAPGPLVNWASPFADLESGWCQCASPQWLLWLSARLSATSAERRAVVTCLAELTKRAEHAGRGSEAAVASAIATAVDAATAWLRAQAGLDELLAAERAALAVAARAADIAADEGARARTLFWSAPRPRPASFATSRAMGAWVGWRKAEYVSRLALAAAGTARAAAEAAWIDTVAASGAVFTADGPGTWVSGAAETAGYAVSALAIAQGGRGDDRTARKTARLIRHYLPCPALG